MSRSSALHQYLPLPHDIIDRVVNLLDADTRRAFGFPPKKIPVDVLHRMDAKLLHVVSNTVKYANSSLLISCFPQKRDPNKRGANTNLIMHFVMIDLKNDHFAFISANVRRCFLDSECLESTRNQNQNWDATIFINAASAEHCMVHNVHFENRRKITLESRANDRFFCHVTNNTMGYLHECEII